MARFSDYADSYKSIKLEREDGILQMTLTPMADRCNGDRRSSRSSLKPLP
jgi:hypothetical protein